MPHALLRSLELWKKLIAVQGTKKHTPHLHIVINEIMQYIDICGSIESLSEYRKLSTHI